MILQEVWGPGYGSESNLLHVHVSQLRRKIEPDPARPRYLLTEPGAGYRLVDPADARVAHSTRLGFLQAAPLKPRRARDLQARARALRRAGAVDGMYDLAALGDRVACFAFIFLLLYVLEQV